MNKYVISAILYHYGYEVKTHCTFPSQNEHMESTSKVYGESFLEEDPAKLELGIVADMINNRQIQNVVQRIQRKCEKKNYIEELDEKYIPTKKKKQQEMKKVLSQKLSCFKENVIKQERLPSSKLGPCASVWGQPSHYLFISLAWHSSASACFHYSIYHVFSPLNSDLQAEIWLSIVDLSPIITLPPIHYVLVVFF